MKTTIFVGVLLMISRVWMGFNVPPTSPTWGDVYKDAAHLFMGGLVVCAWRDGKKWQWLLFWSLNVVEVAVAILSR